MGRPRGEGGGGVATRSMRGDEAESNACHEEKEEEEKDTELDGE